MKSFFRRRSEKQELMQATADCVRDEKLNNIILNSDSASNVTKRASRPYDVHYAENSGYHSDGLSIRNEGTDTAILVQLVERTGWSSRKYMFNLSTSVHIGSARVGNDIIVACNGNGECQCELFLVDQKVYLRNLGKDLYTILRRKNKQIHVDNKGVRLQSDDVIIMGNVSYDITIVDGNYGR